MSLVKKIINDDYKMVIVECGHGAAISNTFLSVDGASSLILINKQPYSKEVQALEYPEIKGIRSVSKEFVYAVVQKELNRYETLVDPQKLVCLATSFQLGNEDCLCHGYFGIGSIVNDKKHIFIYHLTSYLEDLSKEEWIDYLQGYIMDIISYHFYGTKVISTCVDGIWYSYGGNILQPSMFQTLQLNSISQEFNGENFICISSDNNFLRFEDLVRLNSGNKRGVILQKGSFNPFHRMHKKIADNAKGMYPTYPHVVMLSAKTIDKGVNGIEELCNRVRRLTSLGYFVIVCNEGLFINNIKWIRRYYYDLEIVFPVGEDTIERFFRDWEDYYKDKSNDEKFSSYESIFYNVNWLICNRESSTKNFSKLIPLYKEKINNFVYSQLEVDDISSTKIRNNELINEI